MNLLLTYRYTLNKSFLSFTKSLTIPPSLFPFHKYWSRFPLVCYFHQKESFHFCSLYVISVQFSHSVMSPWTVARQASLSITNSWSLLKLMSIESVMLYNHLILCHPLFLPPSISPSIRVFYNESVLHIRWPKYWHFSFSVSPSNEHLRLISFRIDWLDLLAVQGTLKSLLQHHSSKASILQHSTFFILQLSNPYMTTEARSDY